MIVDQDEILEILRKPVNVRRLVDKLAFDADNFEQANLEQPRLSLEAGRYRTQTALDKARLELVLETREAIIRDELRERERARGKKPMTDKAVAAATLLNPAVQRLRKRLYLAEAAEIWAKQLAEAYQFQRLSVLKVIADVRSSEIANDLRATKERAAVDVVRRAAEKMRERIDRDER